MYPQQAFHKKKKEKKKNTSKLSFLLLNIYKLVSRPSTLIFLTCSVYRKKSKHWVVVVALLFYVPVNI